jgi:hypothetical protein
MVSYWIFRPLACNVNVRIALNYKLPLLDGDAPSSLSSGVTAWRKARANPLKQVSTI